MAIRLAPASTLGDVALVLAVALDLGLVLLLFKTLALHPAPAVSSMSLRRAAGRFLVEGLPLRRRLRPSNRTLHRLGRARTILYLVAVALLFLPIDLTAGPLADTNESREYPQTLWQVVAAALGVSVAMVAFAFEAYTSAAQSRHGGTLREFASETRLQLIVRLGALALLINGLVLFEVGRDAPAGWAAAYAIALSAATLVGVPWVVSNIVGSLDPAQLAAMRTRRLRANVAAAMREQLLGQAADVVLDRLGAGFPASRVFLADPGPHRFPAPRAGEIRDVRLGPLARLISRRRRRGDQIELQLHVALGTHVVQGQASLSSAVPLTKREARRIRRCLRIGAPDDRRPDRLLVTQLNLLHRQAVAAVRDRQPDDWREVSDLYELVLLALPHETVRLGIAFEGAVARPGLFGFGPVQRIADFIVDELEAAVDINSSELVDAITYFPERIAAQAIELGAPTIAHEMLALYPRMYGLWIRGS